MQKEIAIVIFNIPVAVHKAVDMAVDMAVDIWPATRLGPDECGVMPVGLPIDPFGLVGLDPNK